MNTPKDRRSKTAAKRDSTADFNLKEFDIVVLDDSVAFKPAAVELYSAAVGVIFATTEFAYVKALNFARDKRCSEHEAGKSLKAAVESGVLQCSKIGHVDLRSELAQIVLDYSVRSRVLFLSHHQDAVNYVDECVAEEIGKGVALRMVKFGLLAESGIDFYSACLKSPGLKRLNWWQRPFSKRLSTDELPPPPARLLKEPDGRQVYRIRLPGRTDVRISLRHLTANPEDDEGREGRLFRCIDVSTGMNMVDAGDRKVCVKLYNPVDDKGVRAREGKLADMISIAGQFQPANGFTVCWPMGDVRNEDDRFAGFVMPMARNARRLSDVLAELRAHCRDATRYPEYAGWDRRDLVRIGVRVCQAIHKVHTTRLGKNSLLLRDVSDNNILISLDDRAVWLVDCDSYQVKDYPSFVLGTEAFLSPRQTLTELSRPEFEQSDELFSLAALIFRILMGGKHHHYESSQSKAPTLSLIQGGKFPYLASGASGIEPEGAYARWCMLSGELRATLVLALDRRTRLKSGAAVSAESWCALLQNYEDELNVDQRCYDSRKQLLDRNPFPSDRGNKCT